MHEKEDEAEMKFQLSLEELFDRKKAKVHVFHELQDMSHLVVFMQSLRKYSRAFFKPIILW